MENLVMENVGEVVEEVMDNKDLLKLGIKGALILTASVVVVKYGPKVARGVINKFKKSKDTDENQTDDEELEVEVEA